MYQFQVFLNGGAALKYQIIHGIYTRSTIDRCVQSKNEQIKTNIGSKHGEKYECICHVAVLWIYLGLSVPDIVVGICPMLVQWVSLARLRC